MAGILLETVIKMPTGKSLSIRVISWLNRFSIDPMSTVARNWGVALKVSAVNDMREKRIECTS